MTPSHRVVLHQSILFGSLKKHRGSAAKAFFFNKKVDPGAFERRISILKINNTHNLAVLFFCVFSQPYIVERIEIHSFHHPVSAKVSQCGVS